MTQRYVRLVQSSDRYHAVKDDIDILSAVLWCGMIGKIEHIFIKGPNALPNGYLCHLCINNMKEKPMTTSNFNPNHYQFEVNGRTIQVVDIMEARFSDDVHLGQAVKYLLRAGHKTDTTYLHDVGKCLWWCAKAMMFHGANFIELPPGTPITKQPTKK